MQRPIAWPLVMWALVAVAFANAVLHLLAVCMPLVASDNWNQIDPFLRDAFAGRLDLGNFLMKRAGVDHAQPLHKLVMWANARWFGLDFVFEGLVAMAFGLAALLVLHRALFGDFAAAARPAAAWLAFAAIAAVFFSLNSTFIYAYSMVTLWFGLYLLAFLVLLAAWRSAESGRHGPLVASVLVMGIVADDSAFLYVAAIALALLYRAARIGRLPATWRTIAVAVAVVLLCRLVYALYGETSGTTQAIFNQPLAARLTALAAQWRDMPYWFATPVVSGLLSPDSLAALAGGQRMAWLAGLAILLALAHAWFWWASWRLQPSRTWLVAVVLMLMFHAHVAAIVLARVFARGHVYLEQPRYVSFYQFGIMALLAMAIALLRERPTPRSRQAIAIVAVMVLLLQVPVTWWAKQREPHVAVYNAAMAADMAAIARDPRSTPADCRPAMNLCLLPLDKRLELLQVLRDNQLSLFAPAFPGRHPDAARAAGLATDPP